MAKKKKQNQGGGQQFLSPEKYLQQKARGLEIGTCYVTRGIDKMKMGHVMVTRKHTGGRISIAGYLVDMACVGVKDSFYKLRMDNWEFDEFLDDRRDMFRECSYEEAHNRVWGSIAYAEEAGIRPDKSFQLTQYMLEEDTDDVPLIEYEYGKDGKHFLVCHSELEASRYLPLMRKNLGEGNYNYLIGIGDPGFNDEDDYDNEEYADYLPDETTTWELPIDYLIMSEIVEAKPVAGIVLASKVMNLPILDIKDEKEQRLQYVDHIIHHPKDLLRCLPKRDMDILLHILANHDKAKGVPIVGEEACLMMEVAGVADCYWNRECKNCVRVADDFQFVALPLAAEVHMSEEAQQRYEVEALISGLANLYGFVSMEDVLQRLMKTKGMRRRDAEDLIAKTMEHSLLLKFMSTKVVEKAKIIFTFTTEDVYFFSIYAWDDRSALVNTVAQTARGDLQSPVSARSFTDEEVRAAGNGEPPIIPNARQEEFWHYLTREIGWDDYYAWRICLGLWYKANHVDNPDYNNEYSIEDYFEDEALSIGDLTEEECEKGRRLLADYVAHIPRWTLKGFAPCEI